MARADAGEGRVQKTPKEAGTPFGKYTILCKLATGGMGELFVARSTGAGGFEKLVVVKRLLPHLAEDSHFVAMLLDEARIAARLSHPNVCQVYELGQEVGQYYIAMEHLEGVPTSLVLRKARRSSSRIELGMAAALMRQACDGLAAAHDLTDSRGQPLGLVHRDVSPSNLFLTTQGMVKLLDFGVAKSQDALARTHTGALKGKYAYMSPEQVVGNAVDRRSDVFSLGVVLFELLTVRRLFWRDSEYKMFQAIVEDPVPSVSDYRPGLSPAVVAVVDRALSRDPDKRFATATEMAEALEDSVATSGGLWRQSQLTSYVAEHFGDLIAEKRQQVQAGADRAEEIRRTGASPPSALPIGSGSPGFDTGDDPEISVTPAPAPGNRKLLWSAVVVVGLAGLGGAGYALLNKQEPAPPPVVVVDGEVETADGRIARANKAAVLPADAGIEMASAPPDAAAKSEAGDAGKASRVDKGAGNSTAASNGERDPYGARLARKGGAIRRCFNDNATTIEGAPRVALSLHIGRDGKVASASVVPATLDNTPLADCLVAVAGTVTFDEQPEDVRVTIPLKIRRR